MKNYKRKNGKSLINRFLLTAMLCCLPSFMFAQQISVRGTVADEAKEAMIGVSVSLKENPKIGTITDFDGAFNLNVPANGTLVFSYMGYKTQEVKVNSRTTIHAVLVEDSELLEEVVVVGYGVQKKVNLTGSVSSVDSKKLENRPVTNISAALSGLAPGIRVTQGSGNPGNESVSIRFRGISSFNSSDPLVLVDGIVADMNLLNSEDIESISFLKDAASAAIYGSRAAAGVILVTTKKGKKEKPTVTVSALFAREKANTSLKFMSNMPDYMRYHNMAQMNTTGTSSWYSQETIDEWEAANTNPNGIYTDPTTGNQIPNWLAFPNTDWAKIMFQPSSYQKYNVSVSGGSDKTIYHLSLGYQNNPGTLENTGLERYNMRVNAETKVSDFITVGTNTYASVQFKDPGSTSMTYLQQAYPGINPKYQGKYGASEDPNMTSMNNVLRSVAATGGRAEDTRINTTWFAKVDIWKGLDAEAKFNYSERDYHVETYSRNLPSYRFRLGTDDSAIVENLGNLDNATTYRYFFKSINYTTDLLLRYNGTFGDHEIGALAGFEQYYYRSSGFNAEKKGLLDWDITDINSAAEMSYIASNTENEHAKTDYAMRSFFGRVNYAYKGRYLFEANLRSDASSRFSPKNRGDLFPSFSAGWRISEEGFFTPILPYVNSLKVRASYGSLGNTIGGNYQTGTGAWVSRNYGWQEVYEQTKGVINESIANGLIMAVLPNYNLKWEKTTTAGLGVDMAFFDKRLNTEIDYYYRKTSGILTTPPTFLTMGNVTAAMSNSGSMTNHGIDLNITWNDKIGEDFHYSVSFNLNYNKNEVTKFQGRLVYALDENTLDIWGNPTWKYTNLDDVSTGGDTRKVERHQIDEYFLRRPYAGNGTYKNTDGTVNPKGGPRDGMIRTKADLEWAKAMVEAGYSFNNKKIGSGSGEIWYGEMLMDDINGDGKYGDSNDREFTGKSATPKFSFGLNMSAEWKGIDLSATWSGRLGSYHYIRSKGANGNEITENTDALPADAAKRFYRYNMLESMSNYDNYDPATDPDANIYAKYPRLYAGTGQMMPNTHYLYNTSYLKLKTLQIGYTLPKKWLQAAKVNKCRVFVAGENLLTIKHKDFPAVDPELGGSVNVYPIARLYSCGINVTF